MAERATTPHKRDSKGMSQLSPDPIRVAVIGCGAVAAIHHLPALQGSRMAEAVLLVDKDRERAEELGRQFGVPEVATETSELSGLADAAIVALPNNLHAPVAIDLLHQGIHTLVEKPMAKSVAECDAMIEAARTTTLAVGLEFRFFHSSTLVREILASGVLGSIRRFHLRQGVVLEWPLTSDYLFRKDLAGGGVLMDFGSHVLDLVLWWFGEPQQVAYYDDSHGGTESDCRLELSFAAGLEGLVEISRIRDLPNTCVIEGERGVLEVGIWDPDPLVSLAMPDGTVELTGKANALGEDSGGGFREAFRREIDDFALAIRENRAPRVTGAEARRSIRLIESCYATRRSLEFPWMSWLSGEAS